MESISIEMDINGQTIEFFYTVEGELTGTWTYWDDTGWEFEPITEPEFAFLDALDMEGVPYEPTKAQIDEGAEAAADLYYVNKGVPYP
jgi:hypothetical protein